MLLENQMKMMALNMLQVRKLLVDSKRMSKNKSVQIKLVRGQEVEDKQDR